jgi:hypothetical protein
MAASAWPQASTATVDGTVRDQSGAVIPNAPVVVRNTATNVSSNTTTNEAGFYVFPGVIPGPYRLSVEVPGMQKYDGAFTVQAAQSVVIDPIVAVAQATSTVQVVDVTPVVKVDNATLSNNVDHARVEQLPMNGRAVNILMQTLPGAEGTSLENGHRSFGLPGQAQEWILDGAVVTDRRYNMSLFSQSPGVGGVEEFTVDNGSVSAKHSRPSNVIVSTKSGTNQLHGTAYEANRDYGYGVARARTDYFTKPPQLIRNEFGANVGGPVVIPKVYNGKNRTFWFFNWEDGRLRSQTTTGYNVPTVAMRNGDFSGLTDSQGRLQVLYDPWSTGPAPTYQRVPYVGNQIPAARESPVAKYLFGITPLPSNNVNPLIDFNYWGTALTSALSVNGKKDDRTFAFRLDHRFSERDQVYVRGNYLYELAERANDSGCPCGLMALNNVAGWKNVMNGVNSAAASWVHIFSPSFFNELLLGASYRIGGGSTGTGPTLDTNYYDKLGMPDPFGRTDWPQFKSTGLGNYVLSSSGYDRANTTIYTLDDNLTKVHGRHEFLFGGHFRIDPMNILPNDAGLSSFTYDTLATALYDPKSTPSNPLALPQTGQNIANMYLGISTYQASLIRNWMYLRSKEGALYFQDNLKATPRLTLNLGLRWEYWGALNEKNNTMVGFDPSTKSAVFSTDLNTLYAQGLTLPSIIARYQSLGWAYESAQKAGLPSSLTHARNRNFGPRLGFAYRALDGPKSFVVRAGYSLSYFNMDQSWIGNIAGSTPLSATFTNNPNDPTQSPDGLPNYLLRSVPQYVNGVNSTGAIDLSQPAGITRGSATASYFDPNLPDSRVHSWNFTLEKEVMSATALRVQYLGSHISNLNQWYSYNNTIPDYIWYATTGQPFPAGEYANVARRPFDQQVWGTIQMYTNSGFGNNQTFDVEMERRYSKGYAYQLSYVMTNALNTGQASTVLDPSQFMPGAVPANYDQSNRFQNYKRDTAIPKHHLRGNFLLDLPVGRNKLLARNAGKALDKVVGGWQLAGIYTLYSNYFSLPTGNWNFTGVPIQMYGYQYPIQNCTGGSCVPGYLWWNGYIPANLINSHDAAGNPNGYEGIPANYKPAVTPLIPWGQTAMPANAPAGTNVSQYWDTNTVWVPLKNNTVQRVSYNNGLNPWRNQYLPSIIQWNLDASLFKNVPIHESVNLRFAVDFFNVFNHPNNPNTVGGDGMLSTRASGLPARVLQLGLRVNW